MNRLNQIIALVVLFLLSLREENITFYFSWIFVAVPQVLWEKWYSLSIQICLIFKIKMSKLDSLERRFGKIAVFSVYIIRRNYLEIVISEFPIDLVTFTEEILNGKHFWCSVKNKFELCKGLFNFVVQNCVQNFKKTIDNVKSLKKCHKDTKTEILHTFPKVCVRLPIWQW